LSGRTLTAQALFPNRPWLTDLLALLAGCLMPLALAPFDFWWSGIIGLVLLLSVIQSAPNRRALWRWYLFGLGHYGIGASWVYVSIHTHGGASPLLAFAVVFAFVAGLALLFFIQGYVYQRFFSGSWFGLIGGLPALCFFREWVTTWLLTGFPWALAGYGHLETPMSGWAPIIGVLGIGYLSALSATLLFAALVSSGQRRWLTLSASLLPFLFGFGFGKATFVEPVGPSLSVSLVQGNIAQETKWLRASVQPILQRYTDLTELHWGQDMVIWPEAALTLFKDSAGPVLESLDREGKRSGTALLLGLPSRDEQSFFNSAVVVGEGDGYYQKRHLVPFGEYVPLEQWLRGAIAFFDLPMSRNRSGPAQQTLLNMKGVSVALSICYEVVFPDLVRSDADQAGLLVTISNDTWFGSSIGPHQHLQMARMRALENGRYLVRATNNGLTAIVDQKGTVLGQLPQFQASVLTGNVQPFTGITPYTRVGDMPLLLGLGLILLIHFVRTGLNNSPARQSNPSDGE
jgi:apolipoprotein N-acyltransferase